MICIDWPGNPIPAPRPRVVNGRAHNPPDYTAYKQAVQMYVGHVMTLRGLSSYGKARLGITMHLRRESHIACDFDNLAKTVCDTLEGMIFKNDSQIDEAHIYVKRGVGADRAGTSVTVWPLNGKDGHQEREAGWLLHSVIQGL